MAECRNCRSYEGDCKHHFIDNRGHIHYDIPSNSCCDRFGNCSYYSEKRSELEIALQELEYSSLSQKSKDILKSYVKKNDRKE